jgi:hypothetical protein
MRTLAWHAALFFIALALSFIGVFLWFSLPTCTAGYRHYHTRTQLHWINSELEFNVGMISGPDFTVDEINDWLAGTSPNLEKVSAEWGPPRPEHDSWGRPLRCKQISGTYKNGRPMLGVYSLGEDGVSKSLGEDSDDINHWNGNLDYYEHRMFIRQMRLILGLTAFFGLPIYLFLAGAKVVADNDPHWREFRKGRIFRFSLFHLLLIFPAFFLGMTLASCFFWYAEGFWLPKLILGAILTGYCYMVLLAGRYIVLPRRSAALPKTSAEAMP